MNSEVSKYTVSVYELIENNFDFGLDKYTIFDESYRTALNNAILNYYMFREIGFSNPTVWRFKLQARMDMIMRNKYNALYKAKSIEFNPLFNVDITETYTHNITNTGQATNNGEVNFNTSSTVNNTNSDTSNVTSDESTDTTSEGLSLTSQFPSEEMTENDLTSNLFIDGATKNTGSENSTGNTTQTSTSSGTNNTTNVGVDKTTNSNNGTTNNNTEETYTRKTEGSSAGLPFSRAMQQLKDFYDDYELDQQVIEELKDLFISCW